MATTIREVGFDYWEWEEEPRKLGLELIAFRKTHLHRFYQLWILTLTFLFLALIILGVGLTIATNFFFGEKFCKMLEKWKLKMNE